MNLALLRICAIVLIVNGLSSIAGALLPLFTLEIEDEPFFSTHGPAILSSSIFVTLVVIALVKRRTRILKILSIIAIILTFARAIIFTVHFNIHILPIGLGYTYLLKQLTDIFVNTSLVTWIAAFFIDRANTDPKINLNLLRFCTAFFLTYDANGLIKTILDFSLSSFDTVIIPISIAAGIFILVKKNTLVLKIYSIILFVYISWNTWDFVREHMYGTYYVWGAILGMIFNSFFVVCAATFFVNPEETKLYAQKLKDLFYKWKNPTWFKRKKNPSGIQNPRNY